MLPTDLIRYVNAVSQVAKDKWEAQHASRPRRGAIGKALIAYLATGSIGVAVVIFLLARGAGC